MEDTLGLGDTLKLQGSTKLFAAGILAADLGTSY
jgi:hypothetical protein